MLIRDAGGTSGLKSKRPAAPPTRPLNPAALETSKLATTGANLGNSIYQGFRSIDANDLKIAGTAVMSAGAGFALADKLGQMRADGRSLTAGGKMQGAGNILLPLVATVAKVTGHNDLAQAANTANDANTGVKKAKDAGDNLGRAIQAMKSRDGAAPVPGAQQAQQLSKLGKLAAGADVARGAISAVQLGGQLSDAIHDPSKLKDPKFAVDLAYNTLGTANGAVAAAKLLGKTGLAAKVNPVLGIGFAAAGVASAAIDIKRNGLNWDNGLQLAANGLDLAGNALILSGVGAPVGLALKGIGLGLQVGQLAVKNWPAIKKFGGEVGKSVVNGAKALATGVSHAASTVGNAISSVGNKISGGLKKVFSGW